MTPQAETVTVEQRGPVAIVRFSSPPEGFISNKGAALLVGALEPLLADPSVRSIVLTGGEAEVFIRHANVGQIARAAAALEEGRIGEQAFLEAPFQQLGALLDQAEKPVIAAINGACMGGGFEVALACTMRIASHAVKAIGLPEIRIDILPGSGGTQRLAWLIGRHRARLFILDGTVVDAETALAAGIIDEAVPCALERAVALGEGFSRRPAAAVSAIMRLTRTIAIDALREEALAFAAVLRTDGVQARLADFAAGSQPLESLP